MKLFQHVEGYWTAHAVTYGCARNQRQHSYSCLRLPAFRSLVSAQQLSPLHALFILQRREGAVSEDVAAAVQVSPSEPGPASYRSRRAGRRRGARVVLLGLWVASLVMLIVVATRSWPIWSFYLMLGIYALL